MGPPLSLHEHFQPTHRYNITHIEFSIHPKSTRKSRFTQDLLIVIDLSQRHPIVWFENLGALSIGSYQLNPRYKEFPMFSPST